MNYQEWLGNVPTEITRDPLWRIEAYQLALFATDLGWRDATKLMGDKRTLDVSNQLYRAIGSIAANLAEGYSRGTGKDRARFYEYSFGSVREARGWYFNGRFILGEEVASHRMKLLTQVIRLLLKIIPDQRGAELREVAPAFETEMERTGSLSEASPEEIAEILQHAPVP